jgi:hypothetical protein
VVDYVEAIKRPFTDAGKLVLGIVLSIIPIVNFIFAGYLLNVAKGAMGKDFSLPEFKEFGKMFIEGILTLIISIVYSLPTIILFLVLMFAGGLSLDSLFSGLLTGGGALGIFSSLAALGIYIVVLAVVWFIFAILGMTAVMRFADTREFGSAFEFGDVLKKGFTVVFVGNWILAMIIAGIIGGLLSFIPFIGVLLSIYIVQVISYTIVGQAYSEA